MNRQRAGWRPLVGAMVAALLMCGGRAHAQKSTEQYIPIGRSPGISQKYTAIVTVDSVNLRDRMLTVAEAGERRSIRLTPRTRIWLDRSKLKLPNLEGGPEDLRPGRRIEVKFENPVLRQVADWVKVEITQP